MVSPKSARFITHSRFAFLFLAVAPEQLARTRRRSKIETEFRFSSISSRA